MNKYKCIFGTLGSGGGITIRIPKGFRAYYYGKRGYTVVQLAVSTGKAVRIRHRKGQRPTHLKKNSQTASYIEQ